MNSLEISYSSVKKYFDLNQEKNCKEKKRVTLQGQSEKQTADQSAGEEID